MAYARSRAALTKVSPRVAAIILSMLGLVVWIEALAGKSGTDLWRSYCVCIWAGNAEDQPSLLYRLWCLLADTFTLAPWRACFLRPGRHIIHTEQVQRDRKQAAGVAGAARGGRAGELRRLHAAALVGCVLQPGAAAAGAAAGGWSAGSVLGRHLVRLAWPRHSRVHTGVAPLSMSFACTGAGLPFSACFSTAQLPCNQLSSS